MNLKFWSKKKVDPNEFTERKLSRNMGDISLTVTERDHQINISAWNPDMAFALYRDIRKEIKSQPVKRNNDASV